MEHCPAKDSDWAHLVPGHMTGDASDAACVWRLCAAALKSLCYWFVCVVTTWVIEGVCVLCVGALPPQRAKWEGLVSVDAAAFQRMTPLFFKLI